MNYYEMLYIASSTLQEAEREELIKKLNDFILQKNGEIITENRWGTRTLAYPINKNTSGYYVLEYIKLPSENLSDLRYFMQINEGFLRSMILRKNSVPVAEKKKEEAKKEEVRKTETVEKEVSNNGDRSE